MRGVLPRVVIEGSLVFQCLTWRLSFGLFAPVLSQCLLFFLVFCQCLWLPWAFGLLAGHWAACHLGLPWVGCLLHRMLSEVTTHLVAT